MAITRQLTTVNVEQFDGGVNYNKDLTELAINESPNSMNMIFDGERVFKRPGYTELTPTASGATDGTHSLFDIGVTGEGRKLVAHMGETVYKMDNLDGTLDVIRTSAPDSRSYNAEVNQNLIQTYSNGTAPYYWDGVVPNMVILSASAPGFRHCVETQGYLLGANVKSTKLRIYYENINTMIDGSYSDFFTLKGGSDDEVTGWLIINGRTYATTKTGIFRISFVGGLTVFEDKPVVSKTGMVPGTGQTVISDEFGEVAIFMGYDLNLYLFDGSVVRNASKKFRFRNNDTPVAMQDIDRNQFLNIESVFDTISQTYRLFITKKGDTANSTAMNLSAVDLAYYPFDNMVFKSATIAADAIGRLFLVGGDYTGKLHKMFIDVNNDNGKAIIEYYESPIFKSKIEAVKKGQYLNLLFDPVGNFSLIIEDRTDFDKTWKARPNLKMYSGRDRFLGVNFVLGTSAVLGSEVEGLFHQMNLPTSSNTYRFRLRSGGTVGDVVQYKVGTVAGTGATTAITGTGTTWTSDMTAANGWKIHIRDGDHANTTYDFTYVSTTSATVGTMEAGNFAGANYELFRSGYAPAAHRWSLKQIDYSSKSLSIGKAEPIR